MNAEVEKERTDQFEESADVSRFTYKCILCNYSTDHSANVELHEKAHNQEEDKEFQCTLCNYSSNLKFVVIRHMNRDHQSTISAQENRSAVSSPENQHYLQVKRYDTIQIWNLKNLYIFLVLKAEEMDHPAAKFESMEDSHEENCNSHLEVSRYPLYKFLIVFHLKNIQYIFYLC